jgi:WXXGXW repeat (2 copies)
MTTLKQMQTDRAGRCLRGIQVLALMATGLVIAWPPASHSQAITAAISVTLAPPAIPIYTQPPLPADGYLWNPGYWAYGDEGYYWVPGVWVEPPSVGLLWTPGYWDWNGGIYAWQAGYWGPHVGFYGGVNYGFGYVGTGYAGGYWQNGALFYNRAVVNIGSTRVVNVYQRSVPSVSVGSRASFHGGQGGTTARPTEVEQAAARETHHAPTTAQTQQLKWAGTQRDLLASVNHDKPAITATQKPGQRTDSSATAERAGADNKTVAPRSADSRTGGMAAFTRAKPEESKPAPAIKLHDAPALQREQPVVQNRRPPAQEQKRAAERAPTKEPSSGNARNEQPQARLEEHRESTDERPNSG